MRALILLLMLLLSHRATAQAPVNLTPGAVTSPELVERMASMDARLFDAAFNCRLEALAPLVDDDLEFIHDKHGRTSTTGAAFLQGVRDGCKGREEGRNFRARRELVPGTLQTFALNNYGAVQTGMHRFYAIEPGRPDRLTETARFISLWRQEGGHWRLARVISYDHVLADAPAGAP